MIVVVYSLPDGMEVNVYVCMSCSPNNCLQMDSFCGLVLCTWTCVVYVSKSHRLPSLWREHSREQGLIPFTQEWVVPIFLPILNEIGFMGLEKKSNMLNMLKVFGQTDGHRTKVIRIAHLCFQLRWAKMNHDW